MMFLWHLKFGIFLKLIFSPGRWYLHHNENSNFPELVHSTRQMMFLSYHKIWYFLKLIFHQADDVFQHNEISNFLNYFWPHVTRHSQSIMKYHISWYFPYMDRPYNMWLQENLRNTPNVLWIMGTGNLNFFSSDIYVHNILFTKRVVFIVIMFDQSSLMDT